jgi:hypothetical protein
MLTDSCPVCERVYAYDDCQDTYKESLEIVAKVKGREVTLHTCPDDGGVIAITLSDKFGSSVYIPSTKEL